METVIQSNKDIINQIGMKLDDFRYWSGMRMNMPVNVSLQDEWNYTVQTLLIFFRKITSQISIKIYNNIAPIDPHPNLLQDLEETKLEIIENELGEKLPITTLTITLNNQADQQEYSVNLQCQFNVVEDKTWGSKDSFNCQQYFSCLPKKIV